MNKKYCRTVFVCKNTINTEEVKFFLREFGVVFLCYLPKLFVLGAFGTLTAIHRFNHRILCFFEILNLHVWHSIFGRIFFFFLVDDEYRVFWRCHIISLYFSSNRAKRQMRWIFYKILCLFLVIATALFFYHLSSESAQFQFHRQSVSTRACV